MRKKAQFKVGDCVSFLRGRKQVVARVIEDRGCIGSKGQRLYRVELPLTYTEPAKFELPEKELTISAPVHQNGAASRADTGFYVEGEFHDPIANARHDDDPKPHFQVGDWVTFPYGTIQAVARIIEDRGAIGHKGRRLYRIEFTFPEGEWHRFEVGEDDVSPAPTPNYGTPIS